MKTYEYNQNVAKRFVDLEIQQGTVQYVPVTYVWIDGTGQTLRSKTKTIPQSCKRNSQKTDTSSDEEEKYVVITLANVPPWNFCATGAGFETKEILKNGEKRTYSSCDLIPRAIYKDPFLGGNAKLVLCEVEYNGEPVKTNYRRDCSKALKKTVNVGGESKDLSTVESRYKPKFGIEQEYTLIDPKTNRPLGWPENGFPAPQGPYYCGVGTGLAIGRDIAEAHFRACLYANIPLYGYNAEVMPGQWEFQTHECQDTGIINVADDLWMARFILVRVAEEFDVKVSFDPKPVEGDWNGSGVHINYSDMYTRDQPKRMEKIIKNLEKHKKEAIEAYDPSGGKDNARRLTGKHETSKIDDFTWGVDDRSASIRISKSGSYFEDRRPASNSDPYKVLTHLISICCKDY